MSLAKSVIEDFAEDITVNRDDVPQTILNGVIVPAKTRQFKIRASVQPLKGAEIMMFEEADRIRQSVKVYSYEPLTILDEVQKTKADIIQYNDTLFEIVSVERWVDCGFIYYKSIARRKDRA
jgi:hypothetical protein